MQASSGDGRHQIQSGCSRAKRWFTGFLYWSGWLLLVAAVVVTGGTAALSLALGAEQTAKLFVFGAAVAGWCVPIFFIAATERYLERRSDGSPRRPEPWSLWLILGATTGTAYVASTADPSGGGPLEWKALGTLLGAAALGWGLARAYGWNSGEPTSKRKNDEASRAEVSWTWWLLTGSAVGLQGVAIGCLAQAIGTVDHGGPPFGGGGTFFVLVAWLLVIPATLLLVRLKHHALELRRAANVGPQPGWLGFTATLGVFGLSFIGLTHVSGLQQPGGPTGTVISVASGLGLLGYALSTARWLYTTVAERR